MDWGERGKGCGGVRRVAAWGVEAVKWGVKGERDYRRGDGCGGCGGDGGEALR